MRRTSAHPITNVCFLVHTLLTVIRRLRTLFASYRLASFAHSPDNNGCRATVLTVTIHKHLPLLTYTSSIGNCSSGVQTFMASLDSLISFNPVWASLASKDQALRTCIFYCHHIAFLITNALIVFVWRRSCTFQTNTILALCTSQPPLTLHNTYTIYHHLCRIRAWDTDALLVENFPICAGTLTSNNDSCRVQAFGTIFSTNIFITNFTAESFTCDAISVNV